MEASRRKFEQRRPRPTTHKVHLQVAQQVASESEIAAPAPERQRQRASITAREAESRVFPSLPEDAPKTITVSGQD